ncbi:heat shock 70 kDa protein 12B-like isoform X2 [Dreissena polymorpha]|nr:heat shock 70 kDa protein 12B-like isoform X2 [Dreissena polymorpha]
MASKDFFLVAAIDFGTTFSGYAFSEVTEFQADPLRVSTCTWGSSTNSVMSLKTPSSILFRPEKTFDSFGFEAEDKYSNLSLDNMHRSWFYFRRFKMMLYNSKDVHRSNLLKDETGKEMPAIDVFAASIRYMKDHLGDFLSRRSTQIRDNEIRWVLTVPAIWDDAAKQFMREAAEKAGIDGQALLLALEPEAASMCCKYLPVERMETRIECFSPRSKYLVLDAGGGTVDITVHEVNPDGTLKELHKANGGPWGGTTVDEAFLDFLSEILGADVLEAFRDRHRDDYIDLLREFETRKRAVKPDSDSRVTFKMPISLHELYREVRKAEIRDAVRDHQKYGGGNHRRQDAS